jgi:hypothetical protein
MTVARVVDLAAADRIAHHRPSMRSNRIGLAAAALLVAACGGGSNLTGGGGTGGGGGRDAGGGGRDAGADGAGGAAGAGSATDPADAFAGYWSFGAGSIAPMCGAINVPAVPLTGNLVTIEKHAPNLITFRFSNPSLTCALEFAVAGSAAIVGPGQTCAFMAMGVQAPIAITSWTLMVSGGTMSMTMAGTARVANVNCTPSGTGTLVRSVDASVGQ